MTRKKTENKKSKLKIFNKIIMLVIIFLGAYYLICINELSVKSFRMEELKQEIKQLSTENNNFEVRAMSLSSYNSLVNRVSELSMVTNDKIDYIDGGATAVAVKK